MNEQTPKKHKTVHPDDQRTNTTLIWRVRGKPVGATKGAGDRRFVQRAIFYSIIALGALGALAYYAYLKAPLLKASYADLLIEQANFERAERVIHSLDNGEIREELQKKLYFTYAQTYAAAGNMMESIPFYRAAGDYPGAQETLLKTGYKLAKIYEADGDFLEAGEAYAELGDYLDAVEKSEACSYAYAQERLEYGFYEEAMRIFYSLGSYENAEAYAKEAAVELSQNEGAGDLVSLLAGLSDEQLEGRERLKDARDALPHGIVATGYKHTIALTQEGTVLASGSNLYGQCNVSDWTSITAVAAGAYHTVGLKADGTLVAAGMNEYGQCDVSGWEDVAAVYAGAYNTVAVTKSGELLTTGYQSWNTLKWRDIAGLAIGDYALCGVMTNGQPLSTHAELVTEEYYDLVAFDAATANSAGLKADGSVVANGLDVSEMKNILAIDCTPNGVYMLDDAGYVFSRAFSYAHLPDVSDWRDVIAISASATHVAGVTSDGRVLSRGASDMGQCETMDWVLFTPEQTEDTDATPEP